MTVLPRSATALVITLAAILLMTGCLPQKWEGIGDETLGAATPTLFGTVVKTLSGSRSTSTPEPTARANVCVFPVDADDSGVFSEAALYRLLWQPGDGILVVDTLGGTLTLEAPINMVAGERRLIILHRGELPKRLPLPVALEPGSAMLLDAGSRATELRDPDNTIRSQTISDARGDIGGAKPALDIITVERQIAKTGGFIVRLTMGAVDDGEYEWSFENIELLLGQQRYTRRILENGKVVNLYYDSEGNYSVWEGTLIVQANTITWALNDGVELPFAARSATSASRLDTTVVFPAGAIHRLWQASLSSCG